jgi:hypothetical protein
MKLKLILFVGANLVFAHLVAMIPCGQVAAQDLLDVHVYDRETIYIHYSILGDGFVKNGQIMDIGSFGSNLAKEMTGSEYALQEMRKARKHKIAGTITNVVATTFSITGIVLAFRDDGNRGQAFELSSLVVGGLCGLLAEGFNRSAMAAMNRAVWLYNRDVVSGHLPGKG